MIFFVFFPDPRQLVSVQQRLLRTMENFDGSSTAFPKPTATFMGRRRLFGLDCDFSTNKGDIFWARIQIYADPRRYYKARPWLFPDPWRLFNDYFSRNTPTFQINNCFSDSVVTFLKPTATFQSSCGYFTLNRDICQTITIVQVWKWATFAVNMLIALAHSKHAWQVHGISDDSVFTPSKSQWISQKKVILISLHYRKLNCVVHLEMMLPTIFLLISKMQMRNDGELIGLTIL